MNRERLIKEVLMQSNYYFNLTNEEIKKHYSVKVLEYIELARQYKRLKNV